MLTIVETPLFKNLVSDYWAEDERGEFCSWLANNPEAGDVIPGSGGCRKVRWKRQGSGKSGGVRIIYYNRLANGEIWLLTIYAKSAQENIPSHTLKAIKEAIEDAQD
ncbi:type II toxin-antitoxin system RelE/ParE family toxin [Ralstonia syzygii]|uniref:type II toxin-antitoxin system RelE/ParE family toxin n=1 Tax=Ralstonia syzygii TaxID=28097 RepID=UPI0018D089EA|nr:type II toxin-antitoxin system RelE/ParE family toxin [Ralstonia syzygii]CAH0447814.1 Toxin HigB-2 [Ralstonia syzygii subsp. syzygii]